MSLHQTPSQRTAHPLHPGATAMRLQGGVLLLARGSWFAGAIVVLVIFFASTPAYYSALHTVSATGLGLDGDQLTPDGLRHLLALGLSIDFYAAYMVVSKAIFVAAWFVVAGIIFWRKSDDRMAFFASFVLVIFSVSFIARSTVDALPSGWWVPVQSVRFIAGMVIGLFIYVFPDGRFVPRWTRWLLIGSVIHESFGDTFFTTAPFNPFLRLPWLEGLLFIGILVSGVVVQIYRYRKVSNPVQRQQTKWVIFGMTISLLGFAATLVVGTSLVPADAQHGPLTNMIANTVLELFLLLLPLSIGLAILRSRLWEIDVIINRSLVYGILTAILALIYVGSVLALQPLLGRFTERNQLAIVGSTLVIAALFQPLRHRLQRVIDRRFYRGKYDAARTVAAFSATLRNEVDLSQLSEQLVAIVSETMQPTHVSLWLRKTGQESKPIPNVE